MHLRPVCRVVATAGQLGSDPIEEVDRVTVGEPDDLGAQGRDLPGEQVRLTVTRNGKRRDVTLTLIEEE